MKFDHTKLRKFRKSLGLTQELLSQEMGFKTHAGYGRYETDDTYAFKAKIEFLARLANRFGVDLSEFFEFDGTEPVFKKFGRSGAESEDGLMGRDDIEFLKDTIKDLRISVRELATERKSLIEEIERLKKASGE